jgi:hypothetical protein
VKVVGTIGQRPPFAATPATPPAQQAPATSAPVAQPSPAQVTVVNPYEHPLVKRAAELFGRKIGDGGQ